MTVTRNCAYCGKPFTPSPGPMAARQRFCSTQHRVYANRDAKRTPAPAEPVTEAKPVNWDTISRKGLEREFQNRLRAECADYRAKCDANVAAYKQKLEADAQRERAQRDEERQRLRNMIAVHKAKGVISSEQYNLVRACLHPDTRAGGGVDEKKLAKAFQVFNDEKMKLLLVKETPRPKKK